MAALPLPDYISQASSLTQEDNVITSKYGDNYAQYAEWGVNARMDKWSLSWEGLTETQRNVMYDFFDTNGLWAAFDWTDPITLQPKKWRFAKAMRTNVVAGLYSITVEVAEDFRLA